LEKAITTIQKRGGEVIFIRLPVGNISWEKNEKYFPRKEYWDPILKKMNVYQINFRDYPELRQFKCPDQSHIDYRDKDDLTSKLSQIIISILQTQR